MGKWPLDLQEYYKKKCAAMKNSDKRDLLINKIRILTGNIDTSRANIEQNCHKLASEAVVFEMESTGTSREQAFGAVYNEVFKKEMSRIHGMVLKKQLAEVELFILSGKPFTEAMKQGWSDDMVEFYMDRITKMDEGMNKEGDVLKTDVVMDEEVGNDNSAHAEFITQNIVSNAVDAAMANMVNNDNAGPSSFIK